ncbi:MAG: hypothetical protein QOI38_113 [Sphingomonadales bacterium]|jgi:hypothetical protein|nr:hypothetical protein [Sphingomonadales bacterium]
MQAIAIATALFGTLAATVASAEPPPAEPGQRLVCRGGERQLSSRIRTARRCRTPEQWQIEEEAANRLPPSLQVTQGQNDGQGSAQPR